MAAVRLHTLLIFELDFPISSLHQMWVVCRSNMIPLIQVWTVAGLCRLSRPPSHPLTYFSVLGDGTGVNLQDVQASLFIGQFNICNRVIFNDSFCASKETTTTIFFRLVPHRLSDWLTYFTVQPAGPQQGRVQSVGSVGGHDHLDSVKGVKAVHLVEQLRGREQENHQSLQLQFSMKLQGLQRPRRCSQLFRSGSSSSLVHYGGELPISWTFTNTWEPLGINWGNSLDLWIITSKLMTCSTTFASQVIHY